MGSRCCIGADVYVGDLSGAESMLLEFASEHAARCGDCGDNFPAGPDAPLLMRHFARTLWPLASDREIAGRSGRVLAKLLQIRQLAAMPAAGHA